MAYIGNTVQNQGFAPAIDYFNGNGVTVTFTLSRPVASVAQVIVAVDNVIQNPSSAFGVVGNSITFTSAPLSGTNNIWVEYTSLITTYQGISQDPTVIGDIRATGGYLAEGDFGNSFVDGNLIDYVTGRGRFTVGELDDITFYHGGTSARSAMMDLYYAGGAKIYGTTALTIPVGTTAERPTGATGMTRYNTTLGTLEFYNGTSWFAITATNTAPYFVDYLIVAGGGGGGAQVGGGGGAGGLLQGTFSASVNTTYTFIIGGGGNGTSGGGQQSQTGTNSSAFGLTALGGGGGGSYNVFTTGQNGGSGGGAGAGGSNIPGSGTAGQGSNGGTAYDNQWGGGGGGGASAVGANATPSIGGAGGNGTASSITGSSVTYAGGGGGCSDTGQSVGAAGGAGGGGRGGANASGVSGTANTGGGGGGTRDVYPSGSGGSGVVIISVPTSKYTGTTTGSPTVTTSGSNTILKFTSSGSYTA